jgi:flavin reductase (DIM6/NTAB) family NADH-FMN oxidoreductase RutF
MEGATEDNWAHFDAEKEDKGQIYKLMISGIQPRPVAFVSSISATGEENLAPYSFFQALCPSLPVIMICGQNTPRVKDTTANIQATKEFTVNIISLPWIVQANVASVNAPSHISEWDITGLTKELSTHVRAPRVKESAFSIECTLFDKYDIINPETGHAASTVTYGLIKCIHVRKDVLNARGVPDPAKLQTVSRLGDISYGLTTEAFRLPRPDWVADGKAIEKELEMRRQENSLGSKI